jgi:hypothetical protein
MNEQLFNANFSAISWREQVYAEMGNVTSCLTLLTTLSIAIQLSLCSYQHYLIGRSLRHLSYLSSVLRDDRRVLIVH